MISTLCKDSKSISQLSATGIAISSQNLVPADADKTGKQNAEMWTITTWLVLCLMNHQLYFLVQQTRQEIFEINNWVVPPACFL